MNRRRLTVLLVGHALAEDTSAGTALRDAGISGGLAAAAEADAGRLGSALRATHLGPQLGPLAEAWPSAVRAADRRLRRIPSSLVVQAQLLQTLVYLLAIALLQAMVLQVLSDKVRPSFLYFDVGAADGKWFMVELVRQLVLLGLPLLFAAIVATVVLPPLVPKVAGPLRRARQAAVAAALIETGAPADVRRSFRGSTMDHATVEDLDRVFEASLTRSERAQRRVVVFVRAAGLGSLSLTALLTTMAVYLIISQIHLTV